MEKEIKDIDLIIVGGGPAGLTAAIYAARAKMDMLLLENEILGGQIRNSYLVENYPGFKKISGAELSDAMQEQAEGCGAKIDEFDAIEKVNLTDDEKIVETESYVYRPKAIIIATGASPKKLPIKGEKEYLGKGVHYCAVCDGAMYEDKVVGVVGGGKSALEEAIFLTTFAKKVYIIRRHDYFNGEQSIIDEAVSNPKIEILYNEDLIEVTGTDFVEKAIIKNTKTSEVTELELEGIFGYIGTEPKTDLFSKYIEVDKVGYIKTDERMRTNVKGVYAAGDVRIKEFRQITTAVADGTIAALDAEKYINEVKRGVK
ncbi:MAG: thioredoxin-disulfide reductase [Clostridium sp.]|uniref:thioredoxin-disulfide reductase n=1 Tax=Clostridium sp. TaxID=1506 RepID=UPI003EE6296E